MDKFQDETSLEPPSRRQQGVASAIKQKLKKPSDFDILNKPAVKRSFNLRDHSRDPPPPQQNQNKLKKYLQEVEDVTLIRSISKVSHGSPDLKKETSRENLKKQQKYSQLVSAVYKHPNHLTRENNSSTQLSRSPVDRKKQEQIRRKFEQEMIQEEPHTPLSKQTSAKNLR
jgi:hypothetical protein